MTANPLMLRQPARPGKVTLEMLHELAASLNRSNFVRDSGLPYFVGRRVDEDGTAKHFLDRRFAPLRGIAVSPTPGGPG